ncbi:MAG: hypothetical protein KDC01_07050, partial [Flavobacteriales bacterium]|nr:hypothetical protein [Flavobacteriales bacterium]
MLMMRLFSSVRLHGLLLLLLPGPALAQAVITVCEGEWFGWSALPRTSGACCPNTTYAWEFSSDGGVTWTPAGSTSTGISGTASLSMTGLYRRVDTWGTNIHDPQWGFCIGCNTQVTINGNYSLTVLPTVSPTISISTPQTEFCGDPGGVQFISTVTDAGATPVYAWSVNGAITQSGPDPVLVYNPLDEDTVTCQLTSSLQCADPVTSDPVGITRVDPTVTVTSDPGGYVEYGDA